jgi:hypothetical protein
MSEQLELFRPHEYGKIDFNPELLHTKRLLEVLEKYLPTREDSYNLNKENKGKLLKNGKLKCHCLFRGKELWQECWPHIQTRIIIARMREELQRQQEENDKKKDTK